MYTIQRQEYWRSTSILSPPNSLISPTAFLYSSLRVIRAWSEIKDNRKWLTKLLNLKGHCQDPMEEFSQLNVSNYILLTYENKLELWQWDENPYYPSGSLFHSYAMRKDFNETRDYDIFSYHQLQMVIWPLLVHLEWQQPGASTTSFQSMPGATYPGVVTRSTWHHHFLKYQPKSESLLMTGMSVLAVGLLYTVR